MTPDQLNEMMNAHIIHTARDREASPVDRFVFHHCRLWTDCAGLAWLRDRWGSLLPVPHVRAQENTP